MLTFAQQLERGGEHRADSGARVFKAMRVLAYACPSTQSWPSQNSLCRVLSKAHCLQYYIMLPYPRLPTYFSSSCCEPSTVGKEIGIRMDPYGAAYPVRNTASPFVLRRHLQIPRQSRRSNACQKTVNTRPDYRQHGSIKSCLLQ